MQQMIEGKLIYLGGNTGEYCQELSCQYIMEALSCLCTSTYMIWLLCLNSRTCYSIYGEASPFSTFQTTSTRFPVGNQKGKVKLTHTAFSNNHNTLGLLTTKEQASWWLIDTAPLLPLLYYLLSQILLVLLYMVQWGAVQDAFFTPWSHKALRKLQADLHHHKAHRSYTPGSSVPYGIPHHTLPIPLHALLE